jgi:uncharacterized protein (TIGR00290 family)
MQIDVDDNAPRLLLSWSSGKDSCWALHRLLQDSNVRVVGLLTTFNGHFQRSAIHGVRMALLRMQAAAIGLPLTEVALPWPCDNQQYERHMAQALASARQRLQIQVVAFGDLYLEDIRRYRERQMADSGLALHTPLWQLPTAPLAQQMLDGGLRAKVTCIEPKVVPKELAGSEYNRDFLRALPESVDPCGENGEFHTFVYDAPMFAAPLSITPEKTVERDGFVYTGFLSEEGLCG